MTSWRITACGSKRYPMPISMRWRTCASMPCATACNGWAALILNAPARGYAAPSGPNTPGGSNTAENGWGFMPCGQTARACGWTICTSRPRRKAQAWAARSCKEFCKTPTARGCRCPSARCGTAIPTASTAGTDSSRPAKANGTSTTCAPPPRHNAKESGTRQRDAALALILAATIGVRRLAHFIAFQEQHLRAAFASVNLGGQRRGVREFQRDVAFPFGFQRRHVDDDAAARVGAFAQADRQDAARNAEVFNRAGQRKRVRRDDANITLEVHERAFVEILGVDDGGIDVRENLEFV